MENALNKYIQIITQFVNKLISVEDFEEGYLQMVKNETVIFDYKTAKVIESLFSDVDAYCGDPEIANYDVNDPFSNIDENELRIRAGKALNQLLILASN